MQLIDILYTPLDVPEMPKIDLSKLREWIYLNHQGQIVPNRHDGFERTPEELYPWHTTYGNIDFKWQGGFDKKFPEFVDYVCSCFQVTPNRISHVLFLPVKDSLEGINYWHADPDKNGLRFYLENNELEDFLLIRPTKKPYNSQEEARMPNNWKWEDIQDTTYSAKLLKPNQGFFINSVRAIHAVKSHYKNSKRLAVIISLDNYNKFIPSVEKLIIDSALKFPDHSIIWKPE
jgi:hypothetical protein